MVSHGCGGDDTDARRARSHDQALHDQNDPDDDHGDARQATDGAGGGRAGVEEI
jgi:hypothetical protein